jgi:hypothetical protein
VLFADFVAIRFGAIQSAADECRVVVPDCVTQSAAVRNRECEIEDIHDLRQTGTAAIKDTHDSGVW